MNEKCTKCKQRDCVEDDFLCAFCLSEYAGELAAYQSKVADDEENRKKAEGRERWLKFCATSHSFEAFEDTVLLRNDLSKHSKSFEKINTYCKAYKTSNNNSGNGVAFVGSFGSDAKKAAFYAAYFLLQKYHKNGIFFTLDYATVGTCLANVFMDPSENYYAGSDLLILDSVDLVALSEGSKHGFNALASFVKYRLDNYRPTLMVIDNPMTKLPHNLGACMELAFKTKIMF